MYKRKKLSEKELIEAASRMRYYILLSIYAARSGHPGGSLSIADITAALYLHEAVLYPDNPGHPRRDRIIFSAGHKAPAQYAGLGMAGFFDIREMVALRKFGSPFQGHPHAPDLPGIEVSTGSLGQGLSVACGIALSLKLKEEENRVFCIMGDGEQQEGSIWEAAMAAGNYSLDNIIGIVDRNRLQIDGEVDSLMNVSPLDEKYRSFGWNALVIDGHDMGEILGAFRAAKKTVGRPTVIIAETVKGKGVSFMENKVEWHGKAPGDENQLLRALEELPFQPMSWEEARDSLRKIECSAGEKTKSVQEKVPAYSVDYWWNQREVMRARMQPNRDGFGKGLAAAGKDKRVVTIHADISDSIKITEFEKAGPSRRTRVLNAGIAEQDMITMAAGLAKEGWIPVAGTYGVFAAGRPWDQIRTTVCNDNLNVKIIGAHGGISVGPDGGTHQALEDISLMQILPNMHVGVPCDAEEAGKMTEHMILKVDGPCYLRLARESTPVVTGGDTVFQFGNANVIRFRGEQERFENAFSITLARDYENEGEAVTMIACGPIVTEVMRAAYILKREQEIEARILNVHTVKPLDVEAVTRAADETGSILVCEEHQVGGFGNLVAACILNTGKTLVQCSFGMVGVQDTFGVSGTVKELFHAFEISAEFIAEKALSLLGKGTRGNK